MFDTAGRWLAATSPPQQTVSVEFYTVQLARLADGLIGVSLLATSVDEDDLQLLNQELGASRVATIDDALAFVKAGVCLG